MSPELIAIIGVGATVIVAIVMATLGVVGLFATVVVWLYGLIHSADERSRKQGERITRTETRLDELSPPGSAKGDGGAVD